MCREREGIHTHTRLEHVKRGGGGQEGMNWWGGITGHRSARHQRQKFFGVCAGEFSMDGPRNTWNIPKESFFYYFFF